MELKGAVVIVTGGGTGIGRATALLFAERGANLVVCGRRYDVLSETVQLIEQKGVKALAIPTDIRYWSQVRNMINLVLQQFGKVDILVNNAGIAIVKPVVETTEEEWDTILDTNLKGVFLCCKAVLPTMLKLNRGMIINVSSILGKAGIANWGAYCASKFGVIGFTEALAKELELNSKGIQVFAVCPGRTNTPMQHIVAGKRIAELSMPPQKVAAKIISLAAGEIKLHPGSALVVDEQSFQITLYEARGKFRQIVRQWLKPVLPILRKIKHLVR